MNVIVFLVLSKDWAIFYCCYLSHFQDNSTNFEVCLGRKLCMEIFKQKQVFCCKLVSSAICEFIAACIFLFSRKICSLWHKRGTKLMCIFFSNFSQAECKNINSRYEKMNCYIEFLASSTGRGVLIGEGGYR